MRKIALSALVVTSLFAAGCATGSIDAESSTPEVGANESAFGIALPPGHDIPVTGVANPAFKPFDDVVRRFMSERCIGGVVVGVSLGGNIVHNRGYGYKSGPPNASCATATDPFVGGAKIEPTTPFRIGSNSKAVLAAIFRKEVKAALSAKRGAPVSDADLESLKLLNSEIELVSPEVRAKMLEGVEPGFLTSKPCAISAWAKVTLGHLLTHTAGFEASESAYPELSAIRGITSTTVAADQEYHSGAPPAARTELKGVQGQNAYFVPRANSEEIARAQGNRCFRAAPGTTSEYSNAGFTMLNYVLEHVTGKTLSAENGYPGTHTFSLLAKHMQQDIGFSSGIEISHTVLGARDAAEPRYRWWSSGSAGYYPRRPDQKRPFCVLAGGRCDFQPFINNQSRFDWAWQRENVDFSFALNQTAPGTGGLAAEAPRFLAFMDKYTVGKPYGVDQSTLPAAFHQHFGGDNGTASWVVQFAGGQVDYQAFALNPNGTQNYDYANSTKKSCVIPKGVNFFFAMNQSSDAKCTVESGCASLCKDEACDDKDKESIYDRYDQVLKSGLCKSDWTVPPQ